MRLFGPSKFVLSVSGISPSVINAMAEGSSVGPNTDDSLFSGKQHGVDYVWLCLRICFGLIVAGVKLVQEGKFLGKTIGSGE